MCLVAFAWNALLLVLVVVALLKRHLSFDRLSVDQQPTGKMSIGGRGITLLLTGKGTTHQHEHNVHIHKHELSSYHDNKHILN